MALIKITTKDRFGKETTDTMETAFGLEFAKAKYASEHPSVLLIYAEFVKDPVTSFQGCEFLRSYR